jgi:hypothetical protein
MKSFGYLKYNPTHDRTKFKDWWAILKCNKDLINYYQYWIGKSVLKGVHSDNWIEKTKLDIKPKSSWPIYCSGIKLTRSAWGSHISVIRGEKPKNISAWKKYDGKKIWFEYDPLYINTNGKHWWVRIKSPELEKIRLELGLPNQPTSFNKRRNKKSVNPFHLTIGRVVE